MEPSAPAAGSAASLANRIMLFLVRLSLPVVGPAGAVRGGGGAHIASTGEIGRVVVTKVENKGRHNKRVYVAFA